MVLVRRIPKLDGISLSSSAQPAHRRRGRVVASADNFRSTPKFRLLDRSTHVAWPRNPTPTVDRSVWKNRFTVPCRGAGSTICCRWRRGPCPVVGAIVEMDGNTCCSRPGPHCLDPDRAGRRPAIYVTIAIASPTCPVSTEQLGTGGSWTGRYCFRRRLGRTRAMNWQTCKARIFVQEILRQSHRPQLRKSTRSTQRASKPLEGNR